MLSSDVSWREVCVDNLSEPTQSPVSHSCGAGVHGEGEGSSDASLPPHSERQGQAERCPSCGQAVGGMWVDFDPNNLPTISEFKMSEDGRMDMSLKASREWATILVAHARNLLADGPNYSETVVVYDPDKRPEDCPNLSLKVGLAGQERYTLTVQRVGKVTPHDARLAAERELDAAHERIREMVDTDWWNRAHIQELQAKVRDLETANAALEAKLAEREWRPIETAPRGYGNPVLLARAVSPTASHQRIGYWDAAEDYGRGRWTGWNQPKPPTHWMPLPPAPGDDVAEMRRICAEEGCAAHSEEMRQIVERELRAFAEASLEEDELYTCPSCDEVDSLVFDKDFWRCICGAPEDESGYRPAGEVERG